MCSSAAQLETSMWWYLTLGQVHCNAMDNSFRPVQSILMNWSLMFQITWSIVHSSFIDFKIYKLLCQACQHNILLWNPPILVIKEKVICTKKAHELTTNWLIGLNLHLNSGMHHQWTIDCSRMNAPYKGAFTVHHLVTSYFIQMLRLNIQNQLYIHRGLLCQATV